MRNSSSLLSVIVPVYNVEKYVEECLTSVINQNYENMEVIVVDDGSTDESLQVVEEVARQSDKLHVYSKPNGGLSDARNFGLDKAKGDFVTFIDSDDVLLGTDVYSKVMNCLINDDLLDVVQYDVIHKWSSSKEHRRTYPFKTYETKRDIAEGYLKEYIHVSCCDKVFRKKVFTGVRFPLGQQSEDIAIIPQLIERINKFKVTGIGYYGYRYREGSISTSRLRVEKIIGILKSYSSYLNYVYTFQSLAPLATQCYVNLIWEYCSAVRKYDRNNLANFLCSGVFTKMSFKEWLPLSMKLAHGLVLKSFISCVLGPKAIVQFQEMFTK